MVVDPYALGWLALGVVGVGWEIAMAATGHPERTLSAYIRRGMGVEPRQDWRVLGIAAFVLGWIVFGVHILFDLP